MNHAIKSCSKIEELEGADVRPNAAEKRVRAHTAQDPRSLCFPNARTTRQAFLYFSEFNNFGEGEK